MKFFSRFMCDHRYKQIRTWNACFFGIPLWSYADIQCIKCGRTKTITGSQYLDNDGKLMK